MPYDDKFAIISTGDEPALAIKAWTRGWDIFYPHKCYVWHHFYREGAKKNHSDKYFKKGTDVHPSQRKLAEEGVKRFVALTSGKIKDERYGLGKARTLDEYKDYTGVDYKRRKIHKRPDLVESVYKSKKDESVTPQHVEVLHTEVSKEAKDKIYVQIASYRDPDVENTIYELIDKANKPDNLIIGVCDQYGPENRDLPAYAQENFRVMRVPFYVSPGLGWARHMLQKMYFDDAEYTMQLDSHMRFKPDWDVKLINMVKQAPSKKPIISHYCTAFTFDQNPMDYLNRDDLFKMYCLRFNDTGTVSFRQRRVHKEEQTGKPGRSMLVSGHFYFTLGQHINEYKYDPDLYFAGDEISLATRSWTRGWDIFYPSENVVFHNFTREKRVCHWADQKVGYGNLHKQSLKKLRQMLGMEDNGIDMGEYGLGTERTLEEFERISGINFKERKLEERAEKGLPVF